MKRTRIIAIAAIFSLLPVIEPVEAKSRNGFVLDDALVPADEILHGGPQRDGIPSLDHPKFVSAMDARFLGSTDRVLGIEVDGVARAYPVRILNYHEIVNDSIGGQGILITYCPLCGSGMAFVASIGGRRHEFGVSGLLYNSDVLLYDRETNSLWSQIKKSAVSGPMKGTTLAAVPLAHTSWREWRARYPDTLVLSTDTGFRRDYNVNPYGDYARHARLYFPVPHRDRRYHPKSTVLGLEVDDRFKAYPFDELEQGPARFADEFEGRRFEVIYDRENQTARIVDVEGNQITTLLAFWFAWYAFHPDTEVYSAD